MFRCTVCEITLSVSTQPWYLLTGDWFGILTPSLRVPFVVPLYILLRVFYSSVTPYLHPHRRSCFRRRVKFQNLCVHSLILRVFLSRIQSSRRSSSCFSTHRFLFQSLHRPRSSTSENKQRYHLGQPKEDWKVRRDNRGTLDGRWIGTRSSLRVTRSHRVRPWPDSASRSNPLYSPKEDLQKSLSEGVTILLWYLSDERKAVDLRYRPTQ